MTDDGFSVTDRRKFTDRPGVHRQDDFAQVIDELRANYRPGVPHDEVPDYAGPVMHIAACRICTGVSEPAYTAVIPFGSRDDRDRWAEVHARNARHEVTLAQQHPETGTTITGRVHPGVDDRPLVAFMVRPGSDPELMCRIPDRAGAAWLATAAYATMLGGGGSAGITRPHRAMFIGRTTLTPNHTPEDHSPAALVVRIDGVLGATAAFFGQAIGRTYAVAASLDPASAEDVIEDLIHRETGIARNLYGVIMMADAQPAEPADEHADTQLREQRAHERAEVVQSMREADVSHASLTATGRAAPPDGALIGVPEPEAHEPGE